MKLNTIYNMDCIEGMKEIPDQYFELAIVDPPYFKKCEKEIWPGAEISTTGVKRNRFRSNHWNMPDQNYFDELLRVSQHQIVWGVNYFDISLGSGRIVWDKRNDTSSFSKCEIAYCSLHDSTQVFRYMWNGMLQEDMKHKERRIHPTQKPVALYHWLLHHYAKKGDKILDTHMGSGSSIIACHDLEFDYMAFEIDPNYYTAAMERVNRHKAQMRWII